MMSSSSRKLCFDGQELVQALVMHFEYDEKRGSFHIVTTSSPLYNLWIAFCSEFYFFIYYLTPKDVIYK